MTREEASFILANIDRRVCDDELNEALDMAIETLEQEPSEDCISRQAVHNMLEDIPIVDTDKWFNWLQKACLRLADLPSVTPQPETGQWIYIGNSEVNGLKICKCTNCEKKTYGSHKFCPNCGAKMRSEVQE